MHCSTNGARRRHQSSIITVGTSILASLVFSFFISCYVLPSAMGPFVWKSCYCQVTPFFVKSSCKTLQKVGPVYVHSPYVSFHQFCISL